MQYKSAWEEGTVRKLHLNLLHNPVLMSFFSLTSLDWRQAMSGRWILAQQRRPANKQHHKVPSHKIQSLPPICRCCSGQSMPGSIGYIGIKWVVLLHQSATITYLTLHLANPCMRTALLLFQKQLHRPQLSSKNNTGGGDPTANHIIREEPRFSLSKQINSRFLQHLEPSSAVKQYLLLK